MNITVNRKNSLIHENNGIQQKKRQKIQWNFIITAKRQNILLYFDGNKF